MAMTPPSLGARIRRARERAQLSQEDLAKAVGASVRAVGDWENDRRKPRNRLGALEKVLDLRLDDEPEPESLISERLRREIMTEPGLSESERVAVLATVEATLTRERGGPVDRTGGSAGGSQQTPGREQPAS